MFVRKYVEENVSAAMLATKRSASVTPEMNLREHTSCMPLPSAKRTFIDQKFKKEKKSGLCYALPPMINKIKVDLLTLLTIPEGL